MTLPDVRPRPLERHVQAAIVQLAKACGGVVFSTSQGYRKDPGGTRCTPGIPDLILMFPRISRVRGYLLWETKAHRGRRTAAQVRFGDLCDECGLEYGYGGLEEFTERMKAWGLVA